MFRPPKSSSSSSSKPPMIPKPSSIAANNPQQQQPQQQRRVSTTSEPLPKFIWIEYRRMTSSTLALCLASITHTYLLFHCFPYLGYMSITLLSNNQDKDSGNNITVDDAGIYAGLLGTAFTLGRCLSFVPWKWARHSTTVMGSRGARGGVKNTLLLSLVLSSIGSIWFGLSTTFLSALVARFFLGLSNTISGCVKRGAINNEQHIALHEWDKVGRGSGSGSGQQSANPTDDEVYRKLELQTSKILAVMHFGSCIGPLLGGLLSNPGTYSKETFLPDIFDDDFPFFLPNVVGTVLCFVSILAVYLYYEDIMEHENNETKVGKNNEQDDEGDDDGDDEEENIEGEQRPLLVLQNKKNSKRKVTSSKRDTRDAFNAIWKTTNARRHIVAYWVFSFVVVCIDEGLPLFLIARLSGPGLSPYQIGWILSLAGLMVVMTQSKSVQMFMKISKLATTSTSTAIAADNRFYPMIRWTSVLGNMPSLFIPIMLVLNGGTYFAVTEMNAEIQKELEDGSTLGPPGQIHWTSFVFIVLLVGTMRSCNSIYFSFIGVATGRTVPPNYKDDVARIMTLGALWARAVAPIVTGSLVAFTMSDTYIQDGSAVLLWIIIGFVFAGIAAGINLTLDSPSSSSLGGTTDENDENDERNSDGTLNTASSEVQKCRKQKQSRYLNIRQKAHIYVRLWEVHYDEGSDTVASKWRRLARKAIAYNRMTGINNDKAPDEDAPASGNQQHHPAKRRSSWVDHILQPGVDIEHTSFFILGTSKYDKSCLPHVLTPPMMSVLQASVPYSCQESNFWLKYSMVRDGASIHALESKIDMSKNTIIAIETLNGDVFGCYMSNVWKKNAKYERCPESFLWRMKHQRQAHKILSTISDNSGNVNDEKKSDIKSDEEEELLDEIARKEGDIDIFRYTGENDNCQLFSSDRIAAGSGIVAGNDDSDGFGFIVEDNLSSGTTNPCVTYDNPSLLVNDVGNGHFEVANIEVWCLTPFISADEAEQSESTLRFISGNRTGDAPSSAASAWTHFL